MRPFRFLLTAIVWQGLTSLSSAGFTLVDDFEGYSVGSAIAGQGDWLAESSNPVAAGVSQDPLVPGNRVLNVGPGGFVGGTLGHREVANTNSALRIAEGTTATVFFRMAWDTSQVDLSVGMTDVANPVTNVLFNSFTQFESQLSISFTPGNDALRVRDRNTLHTLTTDVAPLNWYNVWLVVDNQADTTQFYLQGGNFATPTLLSAGSLSSFSFRNGTTDDLVTFFIATGRNTGNQPPNPTENIGPVYLDDLYIDTNGVNLTNPVPEPSGLALVTSAFLAASIAAARRRRPRHK